MPSNTPETQALEPVEVTQDDRDAALPFIATDFRPGDTYSTGYYVRRGERDDHPLVQAFARHRQSSSNAGGVDAELRRFAQNIFNGLDTGMIKMDSPADETLANVLQRGRAALASLSTPAAEPTGRLPQEYAEAFDILVDVQSALVLTAEHSPGASVGSFVSSSTQYDRLNRFLHARQDADPRATPPTPDRIGKDAVREALREAAETLSWAARRMKGSCRGSDIDAVNLAAGNAIRALSATPAQEGEP